MLVFLHVTLKKHREPDDETIQKCYYSPGLLLDSVMGQVSEESATVTEKQMDVK